MEEKVEIDLRKMAGKPVIKGTRVTIESVLKRVAEGKSIKEILEEYPQLKEEDVKAALEYAAKIVGMEEVLPFIG